MAEPVTKKDLEALQKQIDEVRRWFQDEKKSVHITLDSMIKMLDEIQKRDMAVLAGADAQGRSIMELQKRTDYLHQWDVNFQQYSVQLKKFDDALQNFDSQISGVVHSHTKDIAELKKKVLF